MTLGLFPPILLFSTFNYGKKTNEEAFDLVLHSGIEVLLTPLCHPFVVLSSAWDNFGEK